jgi:hypothetical protein
MDENHKEFGGSGSIPGRVKRCGTTAGISSPEAIRRWPRRSQLRLRELSLIRRWQISRTARNPRDANDFHGQGCRSASKALGHYLTSHAFAWYCEVWLWSSNRVEVHVRLIGVRRRNQNAK